MGRKVLYLILVMVMMLSIPMGVHADMLASIQIMPSYGGDGISGGTVTIYYVAEPTEKGYKLTDGLANWVVKDQEAISVDFAKWTVNRRKDAGLTQAVQWNGAHFSDLKPGIYLAEQKVPAAGYYPFNSFLFTVTASDADLYAYPKVTTQTPKTGDRGDPVLGLCGMMVTLFGLYFTQKWYRRGMSD